MGQSKLNRIRDSTATATPCWICSNPADTREHQIKRSDAEFVKRELGVKLSYYHDVELRNKIVQGTNSQLLKWVSKICSNCNNNLTKANDMGWSAVMQKLVALPHIGRMALTERVAKYNTNDVDHCHIFACKSLGCALSDALLVHPDHQDMLKPVINDLSRSIRSQTVTSRVKLRWRHGSLEDTSGIEYGHIRRPANTEDEETYVVATYYKVGPIIIDMWWVLEDKMLRPKTEGQGYGGFMPNPR